MLDLPSAEKCLNYKCSMININKQISSKLNKFKINCGNIKTFNQLRYISLYKVT